MTMDAATSCNAERPRVLVVAGPGLGSRYAALIAAHGKEYEMSADVVVYDKHGEQNDARAEEYFREMAEHMADRIGLDEIAVASLDPRIHPDEIMHLRREVLIEAPKQEPSLAFIRPDKDYRTHPVSGSPYQVG